MNTRTVYQATYSDGTVSKISSKNGHRYEYAWKVKYVKDGKTHSVSGFALSLASAEKALFSEAAGVIGYEKDVETETVRTSKL